MLHSLAGYNTSIDLNGDGKEDLIDVSMQAMETDDAAFLSVNGVKLKTDTTTFDVADYYIVDLAPGDKYKEVAVEICSEPEVQEMHKGKTYFYRYTDKIEYLGYIDKDLADSRVDYTKEKLQK